MKGWFENESLWDLSWYLDNETDPGEFNTRCRFLLGEAIKSAHGDRILGDGTTYWFEPIMIRYHGKMKDGFRYSWASEPDKRLMGFRDQWKSFITLPEIFPNPAIWHFIGVREYKGRRKSVCPEPICLVNTPHVTADVKAMYSKFWHTADHKSRSYQPMEYMQEAWDLNERFIERNETK